MSGIEVAGIALGVLPLVVSAIENYKIAFAPLSRYVRFQEKIKVLEGQFITQKALYEEEVGALLRSALGRARALQMLADPFHKAWKDERIEREVVSYLGTAFEAIKFATTEIERLLLQVQADVVELLTAKKSEIETGNGSKPSRRKVAQKLAFSFSGASRLERDLDELAARNSDFRTLADQRQRRDKEDRQVVRKATREPVNQKMIKSVRLIQQASKSLYRALQEACSRHDQHKAHLNLVPRLETDTETSIWFDVAFRRPIIDNSLAVETFHRLSVESRARDSESPSQRKTNSQKKHKAAKCCSGGIESVSNIRLNSFFDGPKKLNEAAPKTSISVSISRKLKRPKAAVESDDDDEREDESALEAAQAADFPTPSAVSSLVNSTIPAKCQKFPKDLCSHILEQARNLATTSRICLGCLENSPRYQLSFYLTAQVKPNRPNRTLSFREVLESIKTQREAGRLSEHERHRFARLLATAALQFYNTPWVQQDCWRSEDLYLYDYTDCTSALTEPCVDISVHSASQASAISLSSVTKPWIPNPILFGLALLLIELALEKPLYQLQLPADFDSGIDDLDAKYATAQRLLNKVGGATSQRYRDVVANCLGNFCSQDDLGNDDLMARYHDEVICELFDLEQRYAELSLVDCECSNAFQ